MHYRWDRIRSCLAYVKSIKDRHQRYRKIVGLFETAENNLAITDTTLLSDILFECSTSHEKDSCDILPNHLRQAPINEHRGNMGIHTNMSLVIYTKKILSWGHCHTLFLYVQLRISCFTLIFFYKQPHYKQLALEASKGYTTLGLSWWSQATS